MPLADTKFTPHEKLHRCSRTCGYRDRFRIDLNPVVTLISAGVLWGLVIMCVANPEPVRERIIPMGKWIANKFSWFYVLTQNIWVIFMFAVCYKYGHLKLGKKDDKPEFSDASYFAMLFSAGIGVGMFYYGVSETIDHYVPENGNRISNKEINDNERAQEALTLTMFHYGLHGWIAYVLIGLSVSAIAYRKDLGMTIRSTFYPMIGDHIYGWLGDLIDILSVVATMLGVCTTLGLSAGQLNVGLNRMNDAIAINQTNKVLVIWAVTLLTSFSVVSGLKFGIRRLSELCFGIVTFIMLVVLLCDDAWYLLNVYVQSIGNYIQTVVKLGFIADAFAQEGTAPDGKENPDWMNDWTIFYWGWWIAWSPFVGMFIAKISKGRTIKEFIFFNLGLTLAYIFLWMSMFGGIGLRMERQALMANISCSSGLGGTNATHPGHGGLYRLSCRDVEERWFDVIFFYDQIGDFLAVLCFTGMVLYFVTSSDSGSLVIDCLSANGHPDPPVIQRVFWSVTEGACATGLLLADEKRDALNALQAISVAAGFPYTIVLNLMCVSLWRFLKAESRNLRLEDEIGFTKSIFDIPSRLRDLPKLGLCFIAPWYYVGRTCAKQYGYELPHKIATMAILAILFYCSILLIILHVLLYNLLFVGLAVYAVFVVYCGGIRTQIRHFHNIDGNVVEDFFAVLLLFPFVSYQMDEHVEQCEDSRSSADD